MFVIVLIINISYHDNLHACKPYQRNVSLIQRNCFLSVGNGPEYKHAFVLKIKIYFLLLRTAIINLNKMHTK